MGRIQPWEEERFGVDYLSEVTTADGLDLDRELILEKGSLQEVETGVSVPVRRLFSEKELSHTPTSRQVHLKQTRSPRYPPIRRSRQINNSSTPRASDK